MEAEQGNGGEVAWAKSVVPVLQEAVAVADTPDTCIRVSAGTSLPYAHEVLRYGGESDEPEARLCAYQTDILISETENDGAWWIPRVVIECKFRAITTHDALTYSAKAATHKHVHPYLRYGVLLGAYGTALPARLLRHGQHFDFMAVWETEAPSPQDLKELTSVLQQEVDASRKLQALLTTRSRTRGSYRLVHRPLLLTPAGASNPDGCGGEA